MPEEPLTEEFLAKIISAKTIEEAAELESHGPTTFAEYAHQLLDEKAETRANIVNKAQLNSTYGWQIFEGKRTPGRNTVLRIMLAFRANLRQCNRALVLSNNAHLYSKNRRDAIIIFCFEHGYTLQETDEALYRFGEETID